MVRLVHQRVEDVHLDLRYISRAKSFHDSEKCLELDAVWIWMRPADPPVFEAWICECDFIAMRGVIEEEKKERARVKGR